MSQNKNMAHNLLGIGLGPSNLSLATLSHQLHDIKSIFFDERPEFSWHPGMLLPGAEIQVSYLKDLVTLVDPTNPYSFIAYLAHHKRLYHFINAKFQRVLRSEFNLYLQWVSRSLSNLNFAEKVLEVRYENNQFVVQTAKQKIHTQHLALGTGLTPKIPHFAKKYLGKNVFHAKDFLLQRIDWQDKRVTVIGGGQSGAEIIHYLLNEQRNIPKQLNWITKDKYFSPMDDSIFANELFTPNYTEYFYSLAPEVKTQEINKNKLASDGIAPHLLEQIYQHIYRIEFLEKKEWFFQFSCKQELLNMALTRNGYELEMQAIDTPIFRIVAADVVILCTGYAWQFPDYLENLRTKIPLQQGCFMTNADYSIIWDGPTSNRIYAQNAALHTHGIADPNLSLMAWRSGKIINSIAEREIYALENQNNVMELNVFNTTVNGVSAHVANA